MFTCRSAGADPWWGEDKAKHLGVGLALGGASYGGLWLLGDDRPVVRLGLSCFVAVLPGVAKELYDMGQPGNIFSYRDLVWTGVGALLGSGAVFAVNLLLERLTLRSGTARVQLVPAGPGAGLRVVFR